MKKWKRDCDSTTQGWQMLLVQQYQFFWNRTKFATISKCRWILDVVTNVIFCPVLIKYMKIQIERKFFNYKISSCRIKNLKFENVCLYDYPLVVILLKADMGCRAPQTNRMSCYEMYVTYHVFCILSSLQLWFK